MLRLLDRGEASGARVKPPAPAPPAPREGGSRTPLGRVQTALAAALARARRRGGERGGLSIEYVGVGLALVALAGALAGQAPRVSAAVGCEVSEIIGSIVGGPSGGGGCDGAEDGGAGPPDASPGPGQPPVSPGQPPISPGQPPISPGEEWIEAGLGGNLLRRLLERLRDEWADARRAVARAWKEWGRLRELRQRLEELRQRLEQRRAELRSLEDKLRELEERPDLLDPSEQLERAARIRSELDKINQSLARLERWRSLLRDGRLSQAQLRDLLRAIKALTQAQTTWPEFDKEAARWTLETRENELVEAARELADRIRELDRLCREGADEGQLEQARGRVAEARARVRELYDWLRALRSEFGIEEHPDWAERPFEFTSDAEMQELIRRLAENPSEWTLAFDVDETLTRMGSTLENPQVLPEVMAALEALKAMGFEVMINSGRPVAQLRELFGDDIPIVGLFGGQYALPGQAPVTHPAFDDAYRQRVADFIAEHYTAELQAAGVRWVKDPDGNKNAFPWESAKDPALAKALMARFAEAAREAGIGVQGGADVLDLVPASDGPGPAPSPWDQGWDFRKSVGFRLLSRDNLAWFGDSGSDARAAEDLLRGGAFVEICVGAVCHRGTPLGFIDAARLRLHGPPDAGRFLMWLATALHPAECLPAPGGPGPLAAPRP